jgi:hypothetical protein
MKLTAPNALKIVDGKIKLDRAGFAERLKAGRLEHLTKGPIARELRLADQYRLYATGDVHRRLGLHKQWGDIHGKHAHHRGSVHPLTHFPVHGRISPRFTNHCFRFHYGYGPRWYPRHCWYPRWTPWVQWSWHHYCHPVWDPRPIWCRPVIYDPCPVWVWYESPVWVSLPVVTYGTWVDVPRVYVEPEAYDLQLLAVRFVDPGHPDEGLGPRYRVWFRNNASRPITRPFDVVLLASIGPDLVSDLPQAGVRATSVEAGATQSVDIRLPIAVTRMGQDDEGQAIPFDTLHVLVDAGRNIPETDASNNGSKLLVADIPPVDPAAFELDPKTAGVGGEVILAGEGFGPQPGRVLLHLGEIEMEPEILGWYDLGVRLALPDLPLAGPTQAELIVVRGDGVAANPLQLAITPADKGARLIPPPAPDQP